METYKEKQRKYEEMYKNRGKTVWISIDKKNPIVKGRTFINPLKQEKKEGKK